MISQEQYNHLLSSTSALYHNITFPIKKIRLVPGSFNPLHNGHRYLYFNDVCLGTTPIFEISVINVYKPSILYHDLVNRLNILERDGYNYIVSNVPRILGKIDVVSKELSIQRSDIEIVLGSDVFDRFLIDEGIEAISNCGVDFKVYRRDPFIPNVKFYGTPSCLQGLSSTKIREGNKND